MPKVRDILAVKGSAVTTIPLETTVYQAAVRMSEEQIGSLVVMDAGRVVGILTERDIMLRTVAERRDPLTTRVEEVMTTEVVCCHLHTPLDEARGVMKNRRVRHLPVVNESGELQGLVSIGDLNAYENHTQEQTIRLLHEYIHGHV